MHLNPYPRQSNFQNKSTRQGFPYLGDGGKSPLLTSYSFYIQVMLILILIDVQYLQNVGFLVLKKVRMVEVTPQIPITQRKLLPSKIFYFCPLGRDILPKPLNVIWKTLLGTSSLCIFFSILNLKSSNQGIELQAKGSFQRVATLQLHLKDSGSNPSWYLAVLRSILTRLFLPNLVTKLLATYKSRMPKHSY